MKKPVARPTKTKSAKSSDTTRVPQAFSPPLQTEIVETFTEAASLPETMPTPQKKRRHILWRILFGATGVLVSLAIGLAAEGLIRDLFARYDWLGWVGLATLALLVAAAIALAFREIFAIARLQRLDKLRQQATIVIESDNGTAGKKLIAELQTLYAHRPDMARPRRELETETSQLLDGRDMVTSAERQLMTPLDSRAKALTAAAARRVAVVTAISPRAIVDVAFVSYESFKLARTIAELYGARPGLIGSWRLTGAILSHLAVTGGVALGDSLIQQLVGHGLAAKLSARLGEGVVNGLMTVRVGIAAMRVTRPLPYEAVKQPMVMDFMADLAKITSKD